MEDPSTAQVTPQRNRPLRARQRTPNAKPRPIKAMPADVEEAKDVEADAGMSPEKPRRHHGHHSAKKPSDSEHREGGPAEDDGSESDHEISGAAGGDVSLLELFRNSDPQLTEQLFTRL